MEEEVERLYALAAWKRFDEDVPNSLLKAVTSAFALVAVADGDLGSAENAEFLELIKKHPELFPQLDFELVQSKFKELCAAILSDPANGRERVLAEIRSVRENPLHRDLVREAAVIAMAADNRRLLPEEKIMGEIDGALNQTTPEA